MIVKLIDLDGKVFNLTFKEQATIMSIRIKLLFEYNYNTSDCYFCISKQIIKNETQFKEIFAEREVDDPIIIFNYQQYPNKSYPNSDFAFLYHTSRYLDYYSNPTTLPNERLSTDLSDSDENDDTNSSTQDEMELQQLETNNQFHDIQSPEFIQEQQSQNVQSLFSRIYQLAVRNSDNEMVRFLRENEYIDNDAFNTIFNIALRRNDLEIIQFLNDNYNELINEVIPSTNLNMANNDLETNQFPLYNNEHFDNEIEEILFYLACLPINYEEYFIRTIMNYSTENRQAVMRLVQAGFDLETAAQIYQICNKNEVEAMNFLLSMR